MTKASGSRNSNSPSTAREVYERRKAALRRQCLTPTQYAAAVRRLADELGV